MVLAVDMVSLVMGLIAGLFAGLVLTVWVWKQQNQHRERLAIEASRLTEKEAISAQQVTLVQQELTETKQNLQSSQQQLTELTAQLASWKKASEKDNEWKVLVERQWQQQMESFLLANIKTVKQDATEEYAVKQQAIDQQIKTLIQPLSEQLEQYRKRVDDVDKDHHANTKSIEQELKRVSETNAKVSAIFGSTKGRGNWGEIMLERLLEESGMVEGQGFVRQQTTHTGQRPDIRIALPEGRSVFIDSKALGIDVADVDDDGSESNYQARCQRHLTALKSAIVSLGSKEYAASYRESADFVVLYVPHESMLSMAYDADATIFQAAYSKKVILATPLNLMAMLQLVHRSWKMYKLSQDANDVLKMGEDLFGQAVTVTDNLNHVEKALGTLNKRYQSLKTSFTSDRTGLKRRIEKLVEYGADKGKVLPGDLDIAESLPISNGNSMVLTP